MARSVVSLGHKGSRLDGCRSEGVKAGVAVRY